MKPFAPLMLFSSLALLGACSQPTAPAAVITDPAADAVCELDGMTLANFPGPKGQIHYADGKTIYFCDTVELLSVFLNPEQVRKVDGAYTQDMAHADWDQPRGHWIAVQNAFYVQGSSRLGSMGPTLASFATREDAQAFAKQYDGKVLAFSEITPGMVQLSSGMNHDRDM